MPKIPPHAVDAEKGILGCGMLANEVLGEFPHLTTAHFYLDAHKDIWVSMCEMLADGRPVDAVTLAEELQKRGKLSAVGGVAYIHDLLNSTPRATLASHYADIVLDKARLRNLQYAANDLYLSLLDESSDPMEALARFNGSITETPKNEFEFFTAAKFNAMKCETEFLVRDMIPKAQPGGIVAGKKMCKTTGAVDLCLSLATRSLFLGKFYIPAAVPVGFMSAESGQATIQETLRRIANAKEIDLREVHNLHLSFQVPQLGNEKHMREIERFIIKHKLEFLVLDPAYLMIDAGDGAGNLFVMGKLLMALTRIIHATGCGICLIHHTKKGIVDPFSPPELEHIAWAGFQEFFRWWIAIGRREAYKPDVTGMHKFWMSTGGSFGDSDLWAVDIQEGSRKDIGGRRWDVQVFPAAEAREMAIGEQQENKEATVSARNEKAIASGREKLLAALKRVPGGETESKLRTEAGMNAKTFAAVRNDMLDDKVIEACKVKKGNSHYDAYRLVGEHSDTSDTSDKTEKSEVSVQVRHSLSPIRGDCLSAHTGELDEDDLEEVRLEREAMQAESEEVAF